MGDRPDYEVERGSYWRSVENRRKAAIAAGVALAVLGVAATIALSAGRESEDGSQTETSRTITPAEETIETTARAATEDDSADNNVGTAPGTGQNPADANPTRYVRAPLVSYRRNGMLCVAAEDGSGARELAPSADGVFSLAPDGSAIAVVDAQSATLLVIDVATGATVMVGPATQDTPSWAPDSAWLVYTAPGPVVMRVPRSGMDSAQLLAGSLPSVSVADGTVVAAAVSGEMAVWRDGSLSLLPAPGSITGLATNGTMVWCGSLSAEGGASLCTGTIGGSDKRVVIAAPQSTRTVTFSDLLLSSDGAQLAYAEQSDDGYSRMYAVPARGGDATQLGVRRDCYPLRWTADGTAVLFIEGNSFQGEPTSLMRATATGMARRLLVSGADN